MAAAPISRVSPAQIALLCPQRESSMPASAAFCPGCGRAIKRIPLADRAVAALAHLALLPSAALLLRGAFCLLTIVSLFLSNVAAAMEFLLLGILALLAMFFLWVVLSLTAWQGERFELPIFGMLAGRLR